MATPPPRYSDEAEGHESPAAELLSKQARDGKVLNKTGEDDVFEDVKVDMSEELQTNTQTPPVTTLKGQIFGYSLLTVALLGVSSMGMAALSLEGVPATLAGSWRAQVTTLLMVPFFGYQLGVLVRTGGVRSIMTLHNLLLIGYAIVGSALWGGLFFLALNYTSLAHAYLFDNVLCIIIVAYKLIRRQPTSRLELAGTALGVIGAGLALVGGANDGVERDIKMVLLGDGICLVGCFGGLLYLYAGKMLRESVPLFVYMFPLSIVSSLVYFVLSVLFEGTDSGLGFFSWATPQYIGMAMYLGSVTGLIGYVGYVACLKWVPALVVTVVMLLEPVLGAAMGVIFGVTGMLDIWTIVGGCVLVIGTIMVTYASFPKSNGPAKTQKLRRGASILLQRMGTSSLKLFGPLTPTWNRPDGNGRNYDVIDLNNVDDGYDSDVGDIPMTVYGDDKEKDAV